MQVSIAIDFTLSNGVITDARSLHRLYHNGEMNYYEKVIFEVCNVLTPYAKEEKFNAYGFGGIPTYLGEEKVSKLWELNGNKKDPSCKGTAGVLEAYQEGINGTQLAGPSYFGSLLKTIKSQIIESVEEGGGITKNQLYHLVIIVTDGNCHDMDETKR